MTAKIPIILARSSDRAITKIPQVIKTLHSKSQLVISETTKGLAAKMVSNLKAL